MTNLVITWELHSNGYSLLATVAMGERELLVAASNESEISVRDATTGTVVGEPYTEHTHVESLTATVLNGQPVVISYGSWWVPLDEEIKEALGGDVDDEMWLIRVWDPVTHESVGNEIVDDGEMNGVEISQLSVITDGGPPLLIGVLSIGFQADVVAWNLDARRAQERCFGHDGTSHLCVDAAVPMIVDGQPAIVAALTDCRLPDSDVRPEHGGQVCVWNVRTGDQIGQPWHLAAKDRGALLAAAVVSGQPVAALWTSADDHIRMAELPTGAPAGALAISDVGAPTLLRTGRLDDAPTLLAAHSGGTITVWDLTQQDRRATIDGLGEIEDLLLTQSGLVVAATDEGLTAVRILGNG